MSGREIIMNEVIYKYYVYLGVFSAFLLISAPGIIRYMKKPFVMEGEAKKMENNFYVLLFRKLFNYGALALMFFFFLIFTMDLPSALTHNYKETTGTVTKVYDSSIFVDGCSFETGETSLEIGDKVLVYSLPFSTFTTRIEKLSEQQYSKLESTNKTIGKAEYMILSCVLAIALNLISRFILKLKHSKDDLPEGYVISNVNKAFFDIASIVLVVLLFIRRYA